MATFKVSGFLKTVIFLYFVFYHYFHKFSSNENIYQFLSACTRNKKTVFPQFKNKYDIKT